MKKPFKRLRGNRVYLLIPAIPESKLILSPEATEALTTGEIKKLQHLKVYAVGDLVTDIEEGDEVLVDQGSLARAPIITLDETTKVILISQHDIAHIW